MAKIVCAWCGKLLKEDSEAEAPHVICRECYDDEIRPIVEAQNEARSGWRVHPPPPEEYRSPESYAIDTMLFGFGIFFLWFLVVMTFECLHWLTGGKVPELIQWGPEPPRHHARKIH